MPQLFLCQKSGTPPYSAHLFIKRFFFSASLLLKNIVIRDIYHCDVCILHFLYFNPYQYYFKFNVQFLLKSNIFKICFIPSSSSQIILLLVNCFPVFKMVVPYLSVACTFWWEVVETVMVTYFLTPTVKAPSRTRWHHLIRIFYD